MTKEVTCVPKSPHENGLIKGLHFYPLEGLLPAEETLSVNTNHLIVSLLTRKAANGNPIRLQKLLTEPQMRLLLPLLQSPHNCSHQVLYAALFCSYQGLLAGLFSTDSAATKEWEAALEASRMRMQRAREVGNWKKELKQLYNILSELRIKLRPFGLGIAVSITGSAYTLIARPVPSS